MMKLEIQEAENGYIMRESFVDEEGKLTHGRTIVIEDSEGRNKARLNIECLFKTLYFNFFENSMTRGDHLDICTMNAEGNVIEA